MWVESNPSLIVLRVRIIAAVWAPSPPEPASLKLMSSGSMWAGKSSAKRGGRSVVAPTALKVVAGSNVAVGMTGKAMPSVASFFTPRGKIGTMLSLTHSSAASGSRPRWTGHSERTSTNENPVPATCSSSAFLMERFAWVRRRLSNRATRSTKTGPSRPEISSAIFNGWPAKVVRPFGVVVVRWPMRVVGAICPPVMP